MTEPPLDRDSSGAAAQDGDSWVLPEEMVVDEPSDDAADATPADDIEADDSEPNDSEPNDSEADDSEGPRRRERRERAERRAAQQRATAIEDARRDAKRRARGQLVEEPKRLSARNVKGLRLIIWSVVLGIVTTKTGQLESKDDLKRRIGEAAKHAPPEPPAPPPKIEELVIRTVLSAGLRGLSRNPG